MSDDKKDKKKKGDDEEGKPKGKSNLVPAIVIAVGLVLGGKMMGGGGAAPAAATPAPTEEEAVDCAKQDELKPPKEGGVVNLESQTVNLADGNGVKVTLALQLSAAEAAETFKDEGLGAKAASKAIAVLSEQTASLTQPVAAELLTEAIRPLYECNVLEVLVPQFVVVNAQGGFLGTAASARTPTTETTVAAVAETATTAHAEAEGGSGH